MNYSAIAILAAKAFILVARWTTNKYDDVLADILEKAIKGIEA